MAQGETERWKSLQAGEPHFHVGFALFNIVALTHLAHASSTFRHTPYLFLCCTRKKFSAPVSFSGRCCRRAIVPNSSYKAVDFLLRQPALKNRPDPTNSPSGVAPQQTLFARLPVLLQQRLRCAWSARTMRADNLTVPQSISGDSRFRQHLNAVECIINVRHAINGLHVCTPRDA